MENPLLAGGVVLTENYGFTVCETRQHKFSRDEAGSFHCSRRQYSFALAQHSGSRCSELLTGSNVVSFTKQLVGDHVSSHPAGISYRDISALPFHYLLDPNEPGRVSGTPSRPARSSKRTGSSTRIHHSISISSQNSTHLNSSFLRPLHPEHYIHKQNQIATRTASSRMTTEEMFECLLRHGCTDLSSELDFGDQSSMPISGGAFGDIYRGTLLDGTPVAIKALRHHVLAQDTAPKALKRAMRELYVWSKAKHDNVQELMGVIMFQGRLGMVSPWMDNGNLAEYIRRYPGVDRYELCVQVAKGVSHLHSIDLVHGDIKACNVLVSWEGVAKLCDFDHSILSNTSLGFSQTTNFGGGTLRWMAPELLLHQEEDGFLAERTTQTDVYALGMTVLETITGRVPYSEYKFDNAIIRALDRKKLPDRPEELLLQHAQENWMWSLLKLCWDHNPNLRPPAFLVCSLLEDLHNTRATEDILFALGAMGEWV